MPLVKSTTTITSHLCSDGSPEALVAETRASSLGAPEHLGAAQVRYTCWQGCSLRRLEQNASTPLVKSTDTIPSNLCPDGSPAAHVSETPASSLPAPEHLGAAQVHCT